MKIKSICNETVSMAGSGTGMVLGAAAGTAMVIPTIVASPFIGSALRNKALNREGLLEGIAPKQHKDPWYVKSTKYKEGAKTKSEIGGRAKAIATVILTAPFLPCIGAGAGCIIGAKLND